MGGDKLVVDVVEIPISKSIFKPSVSCNDQKIFMQGRSQELEMGGAKLLGEGSGGRLRPPVGPGQSPGREARGAKPPRKL